MNVALIIYYIYLTIFLFIAYYILAWLYIKFGEYIFSYILVWAFSPLVFFNWWYLRKNSELDPEKNHIAIILCNGYMPERILAYKEDIPKLIKYFKKRNWPYKVYFGVNTKTKLVKIINNPKTTIIYLLGHGIRHGIRINQKEIVYYCEFLKSPRKKFIAQLHCNHMGGRSLVEYISKNSISGFVTNKKLTSFGISKFIREVTKGKIHGAP